MLTNLLYTLLAIVLLGIIIIIHELGHFIVGRLCGIGVEEFSVGFGPKLFGWTRKGIDYSIRALPLGGFCKFEGEDEDNPSPTAMNSQPVWKRFLTVFAGPAMNFVLAFAAAMAVLMLFGTADLSTVIGEVVADAPAAEAGLLAGDRIVSANGAEITDDYAGVEALRSIIQSGEALSLSYERGGQLLSATLSPAVAADEETGESRYQIGVSFSYAFRRYTLFQAIPGAAQYIWDFTRSMLDFLRNLIFKGQGANDVAGAVGTVAVISQGLQVNKSLFLDYLFLISLNLGIMNLLPLPALDGGRLVFLIVEGIRRKPVPPEKEGMVHAIGLMVFFLLAIVLTWHDIVTFILK